MSIKLDQFETEGFGASFNHSTCLCEQIRGHVEAFDLVGLAHRASLLLQLQFLHQAVMVPSNHPGQFSSFIV